MLKGQGPETTRSKGPRVLQAEGYGLNAVKTCSETYAAGVKHSLELCKSRLTVDQTDVLMHLYETVFNSVPQSFHWKNGGVFQTELLQGVPDPDDYDVPEIAFIPQHGLFQHHVQLEASRTRPEPEAICVNNYVAVQLKSVSSGAIIPPEVGGVRIGRVVRVN